MFLAPKTFFEEISMAFSFYFDDVRSFCLQYSPVGGAVKLKLNYTQTTTPSTGLLLHIKDQAHSVILW